MLDAKRFQKLILNWFEQHGRSDLPWQKNKTPYRVWLSEIMLQQTQVKTVIPYYERFLKYFPDIKTLADAKLDAVLHCWSGLGYYSRARNLHQAAKKIMHKFAGEFPQQLTEVMSLPGIGQSTAGAILSITYNQPEPILDGNVKRVLSRFFALHEAIDDAKTIAKLWSIAKNLMPKKRCGEYTQAMMDLGATVCTRKNPNCSVCPLQKYCKALQENCVQQLPNKKAKKTLPIKTATFLIFNYQNKILLQRKPLTGIWGGLWSLPEAQGILEDTAIALSCKNFKLQMRDFKFLPAFRHTFTHFHLDLQPVLIYLKKDRQMVSDELIWYNRNDPIQLGLPKPILNILRSF